MASIAELVGTVRSRSRSAVETTSSALDTAEASQSVINGFTTIQRDRAMARAAAIDARIASGEDPGPLAGVPIGLKDLIDQAGTITSNGAAFPATSAVVSATVVDRLEAAGAVIIGRTGLHEFAFGFTSENQHFGPVRNPWDVDLSPGGSSGGSAAVVAAGVVPAAIGTDTGGSVRVPAALCGVVGLKVTHGRVPLTGVTPLAPSLDTVGPLARTVADVIEIYTAIAGDDPSDLWSAPVPVARPEAPRDPGTLNVGVLESWMDHPIDAVTRSAFDDAIAQLGRLGAAVETVRDPSLIVSEAAQRAASVEVFHVHKARWEQDPGMYGADVAARLRNASAITPETAIDALAWDAGARHALARLFERFDVLVTPTVGASRKVIGEEEMDVDGERVFHRAVIAPYTWPVNRTGNPALAIPVESEGALPASLQLIGPRWGEAALLEIGLGLESAGVVAVEKPPERGRGMVVVNKAAGA